MLYAAGYRTKIYAIILLIIAKSCAQFDASECGTKKVCVFVPTSCQQHNICREIFSFTPTNDGWITMELFNIASNPSANYIAVGFSKDDLMGEDAVTHCGFNDGNIGAVHLSYNEGKSNIPIKQNAEVNEEENVELLEASRENGKMYCKFRQRIVNTDNKHLPNLNETYHLLLAHGITKDPNKLASHSLDTASDDYPVIAPGEYNVAIIRDELADAIKPTTETPTNSFLSKKTKRFFVLFHGMIMLAAWFFLIATSIASARYLRNFAPTKTPFGLRIWFHIHRTLNVVAVVAMLFAVLFIFIGKGWRWTGPAAGRSQAANTSPGAIHSIIGAIAVGLATIQPFGALLRCGPDARARPIFNWVHRLTGISAFILAAIAILLATIFFHVWSSRGWAIVLTLVYLLIVVVLLIVSELIASKTQRQSNAVSLEMNANGQLRGENVHVVARGKADQKVQNLTTLLTFLFTVLALLFAVLLILLIAFS